VQREGGESYLSYEVSISCYTFDSTTLYCTTTCTCTVLPEVLPEVLSYESTFVLPEVHVLYVRKIDCTKVPSYLRTCTRTKVLKVLRKYTYVYRYESTFVLSYFRTFVRKYFRKYFRTFVLSYESSCSCTFYEGNLSYESNSVRVHVHTVQDSTGTRVDQILYCRLLTSGSVSSRARSASVSTSSASPQPATALASASIASASSPSPARVSARPSSASMRSFVGAVRAHVRARYARRRDGVVVLLLLLAASSSRAVFARTRPRPRAAARRGGARTRGSGAKHGIAAVGVRRGAFCARGGGRRGRVVVLFCRVRATFVRRRSNEGTKVRKYFRTFVLKYVYESTFVPSYKVLSYFRTFVRKYFREYESTFVRKYFRISYR
jgi:hypothetical protein